MYSVGVHSAGVHSGDASLPFPPSSFQLQFKFALEPRRLDNFPLLLQEDLRQIACKLILLICMSGNTIR